MKLPKNPREIKVYSNEFIYQDKFGDIQAYKPPKWLQLALDSFWKRAYDADRKSVKDALKELING